MTYTEATHQTLTLMAGPAWAWEGTGSRPTSDIRAGLFAFLTDYANGICALCGMHSTRGEICHLISAGPMRKGFVPANLVWGCLDCNVIDKDVTGGYRNVTFESIVRPDLIPTEWPASADLRARGKAAKNDLERVRQMKREIRGM